MSLNGKIVFITGASAGIGAATALAFAAEGARLLLAARRAGRLSEIASRAKERGAPAVHSIDLDVRDRRAVQNAIDGLPPEWAEIDAGAGLPGWMQHHVGIGCIKRRLEECTVHSVEKHPRRNPLRLGEDKGFAERLNHCTDQEVSAEFDGVRLPWLPADDGDPAR